MSTRHSPGLPACLVPDPRPRGPACFGTARPRHRRRAGLPRPAAVRRAASGRARRCAPGSGRARLGDRPGARPARGHDRGCAAAGCPRRADPGAAALDAFVVKLFQPVQPMLADSAADVERRSRSSARRRSNTSWMAPASRCTKPATRCACTRGPARRDRRGAGGRRASCGDAGAVGDSRRRSDRAQAGRQAAPVSDHDAAVRPQARRRPAAADLPIAPLFFDCLYLDDAPLIDEPLSRRVAALDRLVGAETMVPRSSRPQDRRPLSWPGRSPRTRRRHGQGARRRLHRRAPRSAG